VSARQPPTLAVWLLTRLGLTKRNEPLAGDLLEEFCNGRTAGWYWRQTFMAISTELGQRIRLCRHKLLGVVFGGCAETGALVVFRLFHIPVALAIVAVVAPICIGFAI